jgi:outer membrane protein OmpA-like peptidoglycan-associated protein
MNNFMLSANRVVYNRYGPADPLASHATPGGRAEDRRVEIAVGGLK